MTVTFALCWAVLAGASAGPETDAPFAIEVVDEETGRGVPLVELKTVNNIRLYTDSNGIAAFNEPGLMNQKVFFYVRSHGYEFPEDGFGFRGRALEVTPGGHARLEIKRINVAQRLYRVTGGGIYRDSLLVGRPVPLRRPVLNGQVFGSDSVSTAVYHGRIYWFWGDTNRPGHPLGNFKTPGATSKLPSAGGLDPEVGIELDYFLDDNGFAKQTTPFPDPGPTWLSGLVTLRDGTGGERMFAHYVNVRGGFHVYERGLMEFDDRANEFHKVAKFPADGPFPGGAHTFLHSVEGTEYVYYCDPYPLVRVAADPEKLQRLECYEAFTCLQRGSRLKENRLDRGPDGSLRYGWKGDTEAVRPRDQAKLIKDGQIGPEDGLLALRDTDTGKAVAAHRGSVFWNAYRGRWIMIACESFGSSLLGETWFAEADRPLGPWVYARKIITHDKYSFYNPKQHPMLDKEGGRIIFLEGTYTHTFSGNPDQTPRYDYNQILYKLDLADPRLNLPVAVYERSANGVPDRFGTFARSGPEVLKRPVAFWALERPGPDTVPVYEGETEAGTPRLRFGDPPLGSEGRAAEPVFHVLAGHAESPPAATVPLFELRHEDGVRWAYATKEQATALPGYRRSAEPIALVWPHPIRRGLLPPP